MILEMEPILKQMAVFAILLSIGAVGFKLNVLKENVLDALSVFILKIALPALLITTVPAACPRSELGGALVYIFISMLVYVLLSVLGMFSGKISGLKGDTYNMHIAQSIFGNSGFIGIPFVLAVFGNEGLFYLSIFTLVDQFMIWTLGYYLSTGGSKNSFKENAKKLINPSTVALLIALLFILLNVKLPDLVNNTLTDIGNTTKSLSMIYIGGLLASMNLKSLFKKYTVYMIILFKMIIAPVLLYLILHTFFTIPQTAAMVFCIIASFPSIIITAIFAKNNGTDYEYSISAIFLTTVSCILTIPLVVFIINHLPI